jgi:MYXO-CTERM domain-containing protein
MRRILLKFIPAACIALLSAVYPCVGAAQDAVTPTRMKLHQGADAVKVQVKSTDLPVRGLSGAPAVRAAPVPTTSPQGTDEQGHGTWLAALVLMAAIAIRRQRSERH